MFAETSPPTAVASAPAVSPDRLADLADRAAGPGSASRGRFGRRR